MADKVTTSRVRWEISCVRRPRLATLATERLQKYPPTVGHQDFKKDWRKKEMDEY